MSKNKKNNDDESASFTARKTGWIAKFYYAAVGVVVAFRTENSFFVHLPVGVTVLLAALLLQFSIVEISILVLSVALVLTAELFNTAIESIAKATTKEFNKDIQKALDVSAGAVLVASILSALTGLIIFGTHLFSRFLPTDFS